MANNHTCWQATPPPPSACPFTAPEFLEMSDTSPNQWLHRVLAFMVAEHLQVLLIVIFTHRNKWHRQAGIKKREAHRMAQHALVAEKLFPTKTSEAAFAQVTA